MHSRLRYLRLRGEVEGRPFLAALEPGVHRLGSTRDNDIVVTAHGVSRQHVLVRVGEDVTVEDLGSKNATRVDGVAVRQATLDVGQELFLGPVRLRLEELPIDDVRLALVPGADRPLVEASALELDAGPPRAEELTAVEAVLESDLPLAGAMELVAGHLDAGGAAWLRWRGRRRCEIAASWGTDFHALLDLPALCRRAEAVAGSRRVVVLRAEGPPRLDAVVLLAREDPAALLLWDLPSRRAAALLRVLTRLVDARDVATHGEAKAPQDEEPDSPGLESWVPSHGPESRELRRRIAELTRQSAPILVTGEAGSGKKTLAGLLLAQVGLEGPLVVAGCAELHDAALAQGFRVAAEQRGALLLDEIADLRPEVHEAVWQLVRSASGRPRLLLTTRHPPEQLRDVGTLPAELTRELSGRTLTLEPLRRRRHHVPRLAHHFLVAATAAREEPVRGLTVEALRRLMRYDWPGNVRELRDEVERLVAEALPGRALESSDLAEPIRGA